MVLNCIQNGLKKLLKNLKFNMMKPAETLCKDSTGSLLLVLLGNQEFSCCQSLHLVYYLMTETNNQISISVNTLQACCHFLLLNTFGRDITTNSFQIFLVYCGCYIRFYLVGQQRVSSIDFFSVWSQACFNLCTVHLAKHQTQINGRHLADRESTQRDFNTLKTTRNWELY